MIKVLFVCMGNICRSPTAQGVFENLVAKQGLGDVILVDSAGTHAYHVGEQPDPRSRQCAMRRGVDLDRQRARKVQKSDFDEFHYILAMDNSNYEDLLCACPDPAAKERLHLFLSFAPHRMEQDVPDPYYGGPNGFDIVFDLVEEASQGLLDHIKERMQDQA